MVASDLISAFRDGSKLISRRDDDMYDRLSNRWSIGMLLAFALLISSYSYIGDPIDCYEPQEFEDQWIEYMDNVCWVSNTYYVPFNESVHADEPYKQELQYYQWVPIILAFQAFLFCIPAMVWHAVNESGGYNVQAIVKACHGAASLDPEKRDNTVAFLVENMCRSIGYRKPLKNRRLAVGKRYGRYVFLMYLFIKFLYIANAVSQLLLLTVVLGDGYHVFGWQALFDLANGHDWSASPLFPRVTLCSFEIRRVGQNVHRYTVQCLLSVNLFNEKVFIVLWWWLIFVAFMSTIGLLLWLMTATTTQSQIIYCHKYLRIMGRYHRSEDLEDFVKRFLRMDGVFTLRLIAKNTNDAVVGEVTAALWDKFLNSRKSFSMLDDDEA